MKKTTTTIDKYKICITCKALSIPEPVIEYRPFCNNNKFTKQYRQEHGLKDWRLDYAWVNIKFAVEIDGGAWIMGRHNRGQGYIDGMVRRNALLEYGWYVLYYPPNNIDYNQIKRVYNARMENEQKKL